jgi:hypothetical protein
VGRTSATQGFGGFVFSASSNTFSLLVRALKAQGRVDILSRPQLQVADNQTGYMNIGQSFPILGGSTIATGGLAQQSVSYVNIGISLEVTPRVNPDGKILMRVAPTVSSVAPSPVQLGNGVQASAFNSETIQTTVLASDGETIVLGGLIAKTDTRQENGIPYMKDIPYVGALFRYRTHTVARREILIIMTPHIVRSEFDHARLLAEESARMRWCLPDIADIHKHGMEIMGPASKGARPVQVNPAAIGQYFGSFDGTQGGPSQPGSTAPSIWPLQLPLPNTPPGAQLPAAYPPGAQPPIAAQQTVPLPLPGPQPGAYQQPLPQAQPPLSPQSYVQPGAQLPSPYQQPQPGVQPPGAYQQPLQSYVPPGAQLPGPYQPGAQLPGVPQPISGPQPGPLVQPGVQSALPPSSQTGAVAPQQWPAPTGVIPLSGVQPPFTPPTFARAGLPQAAPTQPAAVQPGYGPFAQPGAIQPAYVPPVSAPGQPTYVQPAQQPAPGAVAPAYGQPALQPGYPTVPPGSVPTVPAGYPGVYQLPVTQPLPGATNPSFVWSVGQQQQPAPGKDVPPAGR